MGEGTSAGTAQVLAQKYGYTKLLVILGGMKAMKDAGMATASDD